MSEADFEHAYESMAIWSKCEHCGIIYKDEKRYNAHLKPKVIDCMEQFICPHNPLFTELDRALAKFNCSLCKKDFDDNKRARKALKQHLKAKSHMAKVNTEEEHKEHQRLCDLVGISVD